MVSVPLRPIAGASRQPTKPMNSHELSLGDRCFRAAFEAHAVRPTEFGHEAHIRLAYIYLAEHDVESAIQRMRQALLAFIDHNGIPRSKFHETITRAWILAVRHFMDRSATSSSIDFLSKNQKLLDSRIMLTHYSASVLFSPDARASFVEPDLDPIPRRGGEPLTKVAT